MGAGEGRGGRGLGEGEGREGDVGAGEGREGGEVHREETSDRKGEGDRDTE